jgi:hypothetical protein
MSIQFRRASALSLAVALGLACSGPVRADIIQVTYSGTITSGTDVTGVFGAPNTDLAGLHYTSTFVFDTSLGELIQLGGLSDTEDLRGGTLYAPFATPLVSSTFQIGATIVSVRSNDVGELYAHLDGDVDGFGNIHSDSFANTAWSFADANVFENEINGSEIQNLTGALPGGFVSPFTYHAVAGDTLLGHFFYEHYNFHTQAEQTVTAELAPDTIVFGAVAGPPPTGAPEPATWAILLAGFAGLGAQLRRVRGRRGVLAG